MQKWYVFDGTRYSGDFWFADYELGGGGGLNADSHFGFWIYYHLLFLYSRI